MEKTLYVGLACTTVQHKSTFGREQLPTYFQCTFYPCIQLAGCGDPSSVAHVLCHHLHAYKGHGGSGLYCIRAALAKTTSLCENKLPLLLGSLQIIHINSALLMIKYNVLQSQNLTGKLDWIYRFEVGWIAFSYVVDLFFLLPCGTSCHYANEELPSWLLIKTSISVGFISSCLITQLISRMPHHHLRGTLHPSYHKQSSSTRLSQLCPETTGWRAQDRTGPSKGR